MTTKDASQTITRILARHDKGQDVPTISKALDVSPGYVYGVLRDLRPNRKRKPRKTTSDFPRMITGLAKAGLKPARIAVVLGVSRQYVYANLPK